MDELLKLGILHDGCSDLLDQIEKQNKFKSLKNKAQHIEESADLLFHFLILLNKKNIKLDEIVNELRLRSK